MTITLKNIHPVKYSRAGVPVELLLAIPGAYLAGGAVRGLLFGDKIADFDFFFRDSESKRIATEECESLGMKKVFECPKGELSTYKSPGLKIQLISKEYYLIPELLMESFDLVPCMFVLDSSFNVTTTKAAIKSARTKVLKINKVIYPTSTVSRISKYAKKGFYIGTACREFMEQVNGKEFPELNLELYSID